MKKFFVLVLLLTSSLAYAECYGSDTYKTCYDDNGNTYDVSRYGNTTYVDGYNSRTGSRWSQESQTFGNLTYTNGTASNGNSWNSTTQRIGNTVYIDGTDSHGNSFSSSCQYIGGQSYCY
jgi:putative signal peptide protein